MFSRLIGLVSLTLLTSALYWTVRLEHADWLFVKGDAASIRQAIRLAPGTAEYYSALAEAEPDRAVAILEEAVALNSRDGSLRVELGLAQEQQGDLLGAEVSLLEAARLDKGFAPRWALSDYYYHRHDAEKFWPVTRAALALSNGNVWEQFRHCWALAADPRAILERAIPDRPPVLRQYLDFLLSEARLDAAVPVADRVLAGADRQAAPSLLTYCDRMLDQWRGDAALQVWNGLSARKLIPDDSEHGFAWHISTPEGIAADRTLHSVILRFSGRQPENTELVSQFVPLLPGRRYTLKTQYRASDIAPESGIECAVFIKDGRDLLHRRGTLRPAFSFQTPEDTRLARIVLAYHRRRGTTRIEGTLTFEKFELALGDLL